MKINFRDGDSIIMPLVEFVDLFAPEKGVRLDRLTLAYKRLLDRGDIESADPHKPGTEVVVDGWRCVVNYDGTFGRLGGLSKRIGGKLKKKRKHKKNG